MNQNVNAVSASKRGYLNGDFKLFHIYDKRPMDFDSHSHDFHKLIICMGGSVTYTIEGKTYVLSPWDILLVPKNRIHHSKTDSTVAYERTVIFISDDYLKSMAVDFEKGGVKTESTLAACFEDSQNEGKLLFHADGDICREISGAAEELEKASRQSKIFGNELLSRAAFLRLMVYINRLAIDDGGSVGTVADKKLDGVISYINAHFSEALSIDFLAKKFYISRSGLMHKFKTLTGGSVHGYINQKRLTAALSLLREGEAAADAARECGFSDYTVFYRSFRKMYGFAPTEIAAVTRQRAGLDTK